MNLLEIIFKNLFKYLEEDIIYIEKFKGHKTCLKQIQYLEVAIINIRVFCLQAVETQMSLGKNLKYSEGFGGLLLRR